MEFKAGDRVRVLRFNGEDVDFYGTLKYLDKCMANLFDCTIKRNEGMAVFLPSDNSFGEDKEDYFVLEEDEEDTKGGNNLPTIKRKVEMNLLQLIEWAWENGIKDEAFFSSDNRMKSLYFNALGRVEFSDSVQFSSYDTFTVITEEEITEDTVIPEMLVIFSDGVTDLTNNKRLNDLSGTNLKSAYIMNDDLRLILIWRDGRLVE